MSEDEQNPFDDGYGFATGLAKLEDSDDKSLDRDLADVLNKANLDYSTAETKPMSERMSALTEASDFKRAHDQIN